MKIGVLMGGISSEREISLKSGEQVLKNLDKNKYEVVQVLINNKSEVMEKVKGIDFAFLALHGKFGEDGTIQAILEAANIPYSGCNVLTSALCMDKNQSKRIMKAEGINTAPWAMVKEKQEVPFERIRSLGYPVVVKPNSGGSSVATFIVKSEEELYKSVEEALKYDEEIIIEQYLPGDEYTVCVLNGGVLPILSIKSTGEFFDYTSKYADKGAKEEIIQLPEKIEREIREIALNCWEIFNCKAYSRVDIIVSNNKPYVLEINTLPGMTKNSLFPKSAKGMGLEYSELLDKIIEYSLN